MSVVGVGLQAGAAIAELLRAFLVYKAQNPQMTEEQALVSFSRQVGSFNDAVDDWNNTDAPG